MTCYRDLDPCNYFPVRASLLAVGWLEAGAEYSVGSVSPEAIATLERLFREAWFGSWTRFLGSHTCSICGQAQGTRNLFVASALGVMVAPELILHYIQCHHYRPPDPFLSAIAECPAQNSHDYFLALRSAGLDPVTCWIPEKFGNREAGLSAGEHRQAVLEEVTRLASRYFPGESVPQLPG